MEKEVTWRVLVEVDSEESANNVFRYIDNHIDEMGCKKAEYYVESATTIAGFDGGDL